MVEYKMKEGDKAFILAMVLLCMVGFAAYFTIGAIIYFHVMEWLK